MDCGKYSTKDTCPDCGGNAVPALPPRYSPDDRYGEYRRKAIAEEYGENGKCRKLL